LPDRAHLEWLTARPIAHRGYHDTATGRVENTLPAFEAAIVHRFAIECDVRETADGAIVVFHDETVARLTTGLGSVSRMSLRELRAVRFRTGDARVPVLDDVLDLVDGRVPLFIEIKGGTPKTASAVGAALATYRGPAAVMAFEPSTTIALRRAAPQIPRGMIVDAFAAPDHPALSIAGRFFRRHLLAATLALPQFIACDVRAPLGQAALLLTRLARVPLLAWTIRTRGDREAAARWADQIIFEGFDPDERLFADETAPV
jgi:glycerophosphoryl diester phosphodiesterase